MRPALFASVFAVFVAAGCGSPRPVTGTNQIVPRGVPQSAVMSEAFTLARGQAVVVDGHRFRFDSVREDNRCPSDVQCVRAGEARVVLTIVGGGSAGESVLEIPGFVGADDAPQPSQSIVRAGMRITLLALDPYPETGSGDGGERPTVTLRVEPIGP